MIETTELTDTAYPSLQGRVVFVTGGATGIGSSIVQHFCAQGSRVAFVDIKVEEGNELARYIADQGHAKPEFIPCNLKDIPALQRVIREFGGRAGNITVLINNAADDQRHKIEEVTVEYWEDRLAVNLRHVFFATQEASKQMIAAAEGSIISFGSVSWMSAMGGMPAYTASKAAIHGLTRGFARDFGGYGIRANTIVPGWVMTRRQKELWFDEEGRKLRSIRQCIDADVNPHDVARMALFLASDDSKMCTAQNFIVDAGWT
jgi:NAD(P)-dependent dehydrogenase (short-subunit alcohol dehydrogenase family)